ncbi:MAG: hydantoinase/oxoprolinase family protein [Solirubrobacteraceae bacterium]
MLLGVDVGGTFTDAVLLDGACMHTAKVPTTPGEQSEGVLNAITAVLASANAKPSQLERFAHGMTVATNALLEGKVARTALIATEGFTDIVELGRQARPSLYRLCEPGPTPLVPERLRFGAPERMGPDGPLRPLRDDEASALISLLAEDRPQAVAVVLLHSYAHPEHEQLLGELLREHLPSAHVSLSHELVGTFREYERAATTEVDAALSPLLSGYLRRLCADAQSRELPQPQVMQSSGGLCDAGYAGKHAALTVLSGPAGGVAGAQLLSELAHEPDLLCFDMGGTSCDVSLIEDSQVAETSERLLAGRPLALPMLDIHTVGAGGGSIAWRDAGGALRVGPQSAGASPGPACYGLGGQRPTVTDANLVLGRLLTDNPLAGSLQLDRDAAERAVGELAQQLNLERTQCAQGIVRVAEAQMLHALRAMSVHRGLDPRRFALMAFGGAGPLHAAAMAQELGIQRVLCPGAAGVLCALGLAAAAPRRDVARTVMLSEAQLNIQNITSERDALIGRASSELGTRPLRSRVVYELRYRGQSFELAIQLSAQQPPDPGLLREAFEQAHEERYGYREEQAEVQLVTIRVSVWGHSERPQLGDALDRPLIRRQETVRFDSGELPTECLIGRPAPGMALEGPAICAMPQSTLLIPPGWSGAVDEHGTILLRACK